MSTSKSMRFFRLLLLAVGGGIVLAAAVVLVVLSSRFQTWLVRRALAEHPEWRATIGTVSAGMKTVTLRDLRLGHRGAVIALPLVEAELPVLAAVMDRKFDVRRLRARGWTIDLTGYGTELAVTRPAPGPGPATAAGADPRGKEADTAALPRVAQSVSQVFAGVFSQLTFPVEVSLDGIELEGEVVLPAKRGRTKARIAGGGFAAGKSGRLEIALAATLADPRVESVGVQAELHGRMESSRSLAGIGLRFEATARGTQFPAGVELAGNVTAARAAAVESYAATLVTHGREILDLKAEFPRAAARLAGTWKVNMRDADLAPFALGMPLPGFTIAGQGNVDADTGFAALHAAGHLTLVMDRLDVLRPELAVLGEIKADADFDLAEQGGRISVQRLSATVASAAPVATIRALQPFSFLPAKGELTATDATRELVGFSLHDVPVAWVKPLIAGVTVHGQTIRGELVGMARGGGVTLRSKGPLTVGALSISQDDSLKVERVDLSFSSVVDYNPSGWQAELGGLSVRRDGVELLTLDGKAGRLTGAGQPLRTTGRLVANLPDLLRQPLLVGRVALTAGDATVEFAASLGQTRELRAQMDLKNLVVPAGGQSVALPQISADVRADIGPDGRVVFSAPVALEKEKRRTDLAFAGEFSPAKDRIGSIKAKVTSNHLEWEDVRVFAGLVPSNENPPRKASGPPWAGLDGSVDLQLKEVVYADSFRASGVRGRVELEAGKVKIEGLQAGLGESGRASLSGVLTFEATRRQPFDLVADMNLRDFDPGPLFQEAGTSRRPTVEGKFDVASKISSRAESLDDLAAGAAGEFQLTSRGGVFRGLPVVVASPTGSPGRVAGIIAAAGSALGGLTGKRDLTVVGSKAQAVAELAGGLNAISFDQLSVLVSRDVAHNTALKSFTLIAPEIRLSGGGTLLHRPGTSLRDDSLAMEFKLRARGRSGELLKYLGALEPVADDLGYAGCSIPIRIGGTPGQPDASELNVRLAALALEKGGVTEKATELFNKLIGGGK